ncbi:MAG: GH1 family beta-glucosidase [Oscillospiraceae bacterium]
MGFKKDFVWGVATSSYQIEGAAHEDGRGSSVWDDFCDEDGRVFEHHNGDVACDHYHLYKQDIKLMAELGVKAYRFSISWPRVLPQGTGEINQKGLAFYVNLVDELLKYGIEPYITLYHWDMPSALFKKGGWLNSDSPMWFEEYTRVIANALKGKAKNIITFNEPAIFMGLGYVSTVHAPGIKMSRKDSLLMAHHVLLAHGRAVKTLRSTLANVKIGFAPNSAPCIPASNSDADIKAAKQQYFSATSNANWLMNVTLWSDPIFFGKYPQDAIEKYGNDMPSYTGEDMQIISQPIDFYGQNIYSGDLYMDADGEPKHVAYSEGNPKTAIGWYVSFDCLYWGVKFLYERYKTPIVITENGMSSHDWVQMDGKVHDPQRIDYLHRHLLGLRKAADEGIEINGYMQWSFMDNFEWAKGYDDRFGLVYIDFQTQKRIPKDSFYWYAQTIRENGENL